jgi:DNA repair protein RadC
MVKIQNLEKQDRPREKLIARGAKSLSDIELIQIVIGSGVQGADVTKISKKIKKLLDITAYQPNIVQLTEIRGISDATATKLVALFELANRKHIKDIVIKTPEDIVAQVPELRTVKQEHLVVLTLDGANRLTEKRIISIGTLNSSLVHPREVFADAITDRAASIVVIHNHPSGTLEPSKADMEITKRLNDCGKLLGISLLDHIIITKTSHLSLMDK